MREMGVSAASPVVANAWMRAQYDAPETDCQSVFYALRPKSTDECRRLNPIASSIQASRAPWAQRSSLARVPLAKLLLGQMHPVTLAGVLSLGSGVGLLAGWALHRTSSTVPSWHEAGLERHDITATQLTRYGNLLLDPARPGRGYPGEQVRANLANQNLRTRPRTAPESPGSTRSPRALANGRV
jgi:hypothetical protein